MDDTLEASSATLQALSDANRASKIQAVRNAFREAILEAAKKAKAHDDKLGHIRMS